MKKMMILLVLTLLFNGTSLLHQGTPSSGTIKTLDNGIGG